MLSQISQEVSETQFELSVIKLKSIKNSTYQTDRVFMGNYFCSILNEEQQLKEEQKP